MLRFHRSHKVLHGFTALCLLLAGLFISRANPALSERVPQPSETAEPENPTLPADSPPAVLSETFQVFFPATYVAIGSQSIQLNVAWLTGADGNVKTNFLPGNQVRLNVSGEARRNATIGLQWSLDGPCGASVVSSETLNLTAGPWSHSTTIAAPDCPGFYISTVQTTYQFETDHLDALLTVLSPTSDVVVYTFPRQGFDRCYLPTIEQMQNWWTNSPYWAFNIYLGGSMFFCQNDIPNEAWVYQAAEQGWAFILTWVGPQAPCTNFREKISSNPTTARSQGRSEAEAALNAARGRGFLSNAVIYYDMEGYGSSACREAVDAFILGWSERLHQLGVKAGGYGSPATSHIADWADNNPAPDDVWIAHWVYYCRDDNNNYYFCYNPNATVWSSYLANTLWANHQRLRQYTGGHRETWGGVSLVIDSNALDGELTRIPGLGPEAVGGEPEAVLLSATPTIQAMQRLSPQAGWVLRDGGLLLTDDGGGSWRDVTTTTEGVGPILAVEFLDSQQGWLARLPAQLELSPEIEILRTADGGLSWESSSLSLAGGAYDSPIANAHLEFSDAQNGFLALKLQSGGSFSLGRLFATSDGGQTWEERLLPLGEPVAFLDAERGWTAGGPAGDQLFHTLDGGRTWQPQHIPLPAELDYGQVFIGLPQFDAGGAGYLPVTVAQTGGSSLLVLRSQDLGSSWEVAQKIDLDPAFTPGIGLPFSLASDGAWRVGIGEGMLAGAEPRGVFQALDATGLPQGVIALDFDGSQNGWALAQEGNCYGEKTSPGGGDQPLRCEQVTRLLATTDGGQTWRDIILP